MDFASLATKLVAKDHAYHLNQLIDWLDDRLPFLNFRINDGEFHCMFRLSPETHRNNCGHLYFTDLGDALLGIFPELRNVLRSELNPRIQVGSYWYRQGPGYNYMDEPARRFVAYMEKLGILEEVPWAGSEDMVKGAEDGTTIELFDMIRTRSLDTKVYLVGNSGIAQGRFSLGAEFIEIPRIDCWAYTSQLMHICEPLAKEGAIFVWCNGMSKPWIWNLWQKHRNSTHLDAGHLFDGVFGDYSRAWLRRQEGPLWEAYSGKFTPYVKSFIR